jgi:hypothetical protein
MSRLRANQPTRAHVLKATRRAELADRTRLVAEARTATASRFRTRWSLRDGTAGSSSAATSAPDRLAQARPRRWLSSCSLGEEAIRLGGDVTPADGCIRTTAATRTPRRRTRRTELRSLLPRALRWFGVRSQGARRSPEAGPAPRRARTLGCLCRVASAAPPPRPRWAGPKIRLPRLECRQAEAWLGQRTMIKAIVGDAADRCARGGNSLWPMPSDVTAATRQASPVVRGGARSLAGSSACLRNTRPEVRVLPGASDRDPAGPHGAESEP